MSIETIEGAWPLIKTSGEIDLSNIDVLRSAIDAAIQKSPKAIIIDLQDITYIDSAGVAVIIAAYRRMNKAGGILAVVKPSSAGVRRVLDLIGLHLLPDIVIADDTVSVEKGLSARTAQISV